MHHQHHYSANQMTAAVARNLLQAGKRLRVTIGTSSEDPVVVLSLSDGMVMCESVAGWSAGTVEPGGQR